MRGRVIGRASGPVCPLLFGPIGHQPPIWYQPAWPRMRAFALPTYSDGFVRVNVLGREAHGLVAASDYEAVCDELTRALHDLVDARSGAPIVKEVVRTRRPPRTWKAARCSPSRDAGPLAAIPRRFSRPRAGRSIARAPSEDRGAA